MTTSYQQHPGCRRDGLGAGERRPVLGVARAYPEGCVYVGPVVFTLDRLAAVVGLTDLFHENSTGNEAFWSGICGSAPGAAGPVVLCMLFRSGTQRDGEEFDKPLLHLGPVEVMAREMPYHKANDLVPRSEDRVRRL
ncbi:hypothetical protein J3458_006873 [Metarhizium acridum]|uniref:uncharacterized protein n=1 Tax=Metarhizium acridum TaxID=92637 RepID=UPI001C6AC046|nr:hypothetical protein J3458_006873 [Metarhizium acridum]